MQRRPSVAAVLATTLVLAACDSGSDIQPIEPPENAAEPEPEPEPEPVEEPEDDVPEIFQGQLYPPLPELQPDPAAGDIEPQEQVLAIHRDLYELELAALATNEVDRSSFEQLGAPDYVDGLLEEVEGQKDGAFVSVNPDGSIPWVDVIVADRQEVVIGQCVVLGPLAGGYALESGEPTFDEADSRELEVVQTYTYRADADAPRGWYAVNFTSEQREGCSAR